MIEDVPDTPRALFVTCDAPSVERRLTELRQAGLPVSADSVATRVEFEQALASRNYDFIAAEYQLSGWNGTDVTEYVREYGGGVPVIVISSAGDAEAAADCLRRGARDHVREDRPERLAGAVERILKHHAGAGAQPLKERAFGVMCADLDGSILGANAGTARILGFDAPAELVGRTLADFLDSAGLHGRLLDELRRGSLVTGAEIRLRRRDGRPVWVLADLHPVESGTTIVEGTLIDITDLKRAEQKTAQLDRLCSAAVRLSEAFAAIHDRDRLLQSACRIAVENGGCSIAWIGLRDTPAGPVRRVAQYGAPPDDLPEAGSSEPGSAIVVNNLDASTLPVPRCLDTGRLEYGSCAALPLTSGERFAGVLNLYAAEPEFFNARNLERIRGIAADLSAALGNLERRSADAERERLHLGLRPSAEQVRAETRFRELLEAAPDAIIESDASGSILLVNPAAETLFRCTRDELLSLRLEDLLPDTPHPDDEFFSRLRTRAAGDGASLVARRRDGSEFPVELSVSRAETPHGEIVTCIIRDITARLQTEAALLESNLGTTRILESITDAFFALDRDWRYTYLNGRAEQILGRKREDLQAKNIWDEFPDLVGTVFEQEFHRSAAEQRPAEFTAYDARLKLWADVHVYPSEHGLSVYFQDVTARKLLEEQSGQSQRLEALGRLAGGVAHDFNNLLTVIGGYSQMLLDGMEGKNPLRKDVEPIAEAAGRASALTRQLLAFSRRQLVQPKILDINRLITKMNKMLQRVIGEDIELKRILRSDLGRIKADPGQIEQVIMNLAVNARDAMPTGGTLTVLTDNVEIPEGAGPAPGSYVLLATTDTGSGMDEQTRTHAFEPFFTTKARGKGTGLGLATVYGIVKQAGGDILIDSEPGRGTSFRIYLPRARKASKARPAAAVRRRPRRGTETVLLVEDEPEVRKLAREMLSRLGYHVLEAGDAVQAVSVWNEFGDSVDLLITDVIMPHMSGRELAGKLAALRPSLKILYISGYTDEVIARHGVLQSDAALLEKPFTRESLGLKVRSVLDARAR
jgi:two-component system, cell cycle sensor histidine kinase and response regulator CckA